MTSGTRSFSGPKPLDWDSTATSSLVAVAERHDLVLTHGDGSQAEIGASRIGIEYRVYAPLSAGKTPITEYGVFEGLKLPIKGKVVWKLP
jgi:hypothetical protein